MSESFVIQTRGLTRYFGMNSAVYELNFEVPRGREIFAPRSRADAPQLSVTGTVR